MELVFIYGTLKQGQCRESSMNSARYLGTATIASNFAIYNCGQYPALVKLQDTQPNNVRGEIYEVDEEHLEVLDRIEGVPYLYKRDAVEISVFMCSNLPTTLHTHEQFKQKRVISYFYVDHERLLDEAELIETGFWTDELKK